MKRHLWILAIALASVASAQERRGVDITKRRVVERPTEELVRDLGPLPAADVPAAEVPAAGSDNPPAEPGKVKWHQDVATAIAAAKQTGKPVLVFHLLGQLDQRFT